MPRLDDCSMVALTHSLITQEQLCQLVKQEVDLYAANTLDGHPVFLILPRFAENKPAR